MKQYLDLLQKVLETGTERQDRTGTGTIGLFGAQMRFDLREGFPLVTTKRVYWHGVVSELLWFLRGATNAAELQKEGVHIWDAWAVMDPVYYETPLSGDDRLSLFFKMYPEVDVAGKMEEFKRMSREELIATLDMAGVPITHRQALIDSGELGPIYGRQWRSWMGVRKGAIDQIANVIEGLKSNPYSRRHIVSAWNPDDLPSESLSPQENVINGNMALAPCHCLFQFHVTPMTLLERIALFTERHGTNTHLDGLYAEYEANLHTCETGVEAAERTDAVNAQVEAILNVAGIPDKKLSCQLYQRSADLVLGVPFNIASYALLTHMVAQACDMGVGEFIWTGGDVHVYKNHLDQVKEQLQREPRALPTLKLNPFVRDVFEFKHVDIAVFGYDPHPAIKASVAV